MGFIIPEIVKKQIDLIVDYKVISYNEHRDNISDFCIKIKEYINTEDCFVILHSHEVITKTTHLEKIYDIIQSHPNKEIYIHSSTSSLIQHGTHPLLNVWMWSRSYGFIDTDYFYRNKKKILFSKNMYVNFNNINIDKKNIKSILSCRNYNPYRKYLFNNLNSDDTEILRYVNYNYTDEMLETVSKNYRLDKFPNFFELIDEYYSSIFSFVAETFNYKNTPPVLTEKTILAFLTGTIPIVIGTDNTISNLQKMGFWIANYEFGYDDADYNGDYFYKTDKFITCIKNVKKLSFVESKQYWINNKDKIYNNWYILSELYKYPCKPLI